MSRSNLRITLSASDTFSYLTSGSNAATYANISNGGDAGHSGYDGLNRATSRNSDTFGNNQWTSVNGTTNTYTANSLNQYSQISVPSVPSGAPSKAWQNLQIERYLPYELTIT